MNLVIVIDREMNIQQENIRKEFKEVYSQIHDLLKNRVVITDSLLRGKHEDLLKLTYKKHNKTNKLPDFWSPLEENKNTFESYEELFEKLKYYQKDSVIVYSNSFNIDLLPYCEKVYQFSCNEKLEEGEKFCSLNKAKGWKLVDDSKVFYENNHTFCLLVYENKRLSKIKK